MIYRDRDPVLVVVGTRITENESVKLAKHASRLNLKNGSLLRALLRAYLANIKNGDRFIAQL